MIQNQLEVVADEWVQNPVDNTHDTKNSIDNPQDIINNDIESDKSEVKKDINDNENEDTKILSMSFKVVFYSFDYLFLYVQHKALLFICSFFLAIEFEFPMI